MSITTTPSAHDWPDLPLEDLLEERSDAFNAEWDAEDPLTIITETFAGDYYRQHALLDSDPEVYVYEDEVPRFSAPPGEPLSGVARRGTNANGSLVWHELHLARWASPSSVLHEAAHLVGPIEPYHGKEWLAHYRALVMERYGNDGEEAFDWAVTEAIEAWT